MGSGVIKPNISTLMGMTYDQQRPGQDKLRSDGFAMFYGAINIGAAISSFAMPALRTGYGYQVAFLFPAGLMAVSLLFFAAGKPFYATETIRRVKLSPEDRHERRVVLRRIIGLFVVVTFFWSIFDQSATHLDAIRPRPSGPEFLGWKLTPDQIQGLNPILIILLLPPITMLWHLLARMGFRTAADRQDVHRLRAHGRYDGHHVGGRLPCRRDRPGVGVLGSRPYVLITAAEICISVVGLELAFAAGAATMKSFVTACWLLAVFFGDMLEQLHHAAVRMEDPGPGPHALAGRLFRPVRLADGPRNAGLCARG